MQLYLYCLTFDYSTVIISFFIYFFIFIVLEQKMQRTVSHEKPGS